LTWISFPNSSIQFLSRFKISKFKHATMSHNILQTQKKKREKRLPPLSTTFPHKPLLHLTWSPHYSPSAMKHRTTHTTNPDAA
jgi:hypothetical protein